MIGFLEMSKKKEIWNCKREAINVDRSQNDQGRIENCIFIKLNLDKIQLLLLGFGRETFHFILVRRWSIVNKIN